MQNLKGKVAVITGGGSGLGRELALRCAARGMKLVLGDVDEAGMQETLSQVKALDAGIESATMRLDVSKLDQVEAFAALAKSRFGGAHLLFNNAGVSVWRRLGPESVYPDDDRAGRRSYRQRRFCRWLGQRPEHGRV